MINKKLTTTVPPKKGPNSQVPPVKLSCGGMHKNNGGMGCGCDDCMSQGARGTKRIQVKGFNFQGVR
jgi:hypothetical protein